MPVETRTRIMLFLPAPTTLPQFYLVDSATTDLLDTCGGVTVSSDIPAAFTGLWLKNNQTYKDENILLMGDTPVSMGDADFAVWLDSFKLKCQKEFGEDIIWITLHAITRVTTNDFVK